MKSILLKRVIAVLGLCLCLALINWKIVEKETHLSTGQVVLLELAPVDPRSLMQGDFMALRYAMETSILQAVSKSAITSDATEGGIDGFAWISLTDDDIAQLHAVTANNETVPTEPKKNLIPLQFRVRASTVKLGTDAFFFQEGTGSVYETARFGKFRVSKAGELLLTDLVDKELQTIRPPTN